MKGEEGIERVRDSDDPVFGKKSWREEEFQSWEDAQCENERQ